MRANKTDFNLFPTPVTHWRGLLKTIEVQSIVDFCKNYKSGQHNMLEGDAVCSSGSTRPLSHTDSILREIDKTLGLDLSEALEDVLNRYAKQYGIQPVTLTNSWFNLQSEGSVLRQHNHPFSVISAALFVNCVMTFDMTGVEVLVGIAVLVGVEVLVGIDVLVGEEVKVGIDNISLYL